MDRINKKARARRLALGLCALAVGGLGAGIAVPLAETAPTQAAVAQPGGFADTATNPDETGFGAHAASGNLIFAATKRNARPEPVSDRDPLWSRTVEATTVDGTKREISVTESFGNERAYMPILAYGNHFYDYVHTRTQSHVKAMVFPGWSTAERFVQATFDSNVTRILKHVKLASIVSTDLLKSVHPGVADEVKALDVDYGGFVAKYGASEAARLLSDLAKTHEIGYLRVTGLTDANATDLPALAGFAGLRKLALEGTYSSIAPFAFPSDLLELEINSPNVKAIDPLALPEKAALIHEQGFGAVFDSIDLSGRADLAVGSLQQAVNIVYGRRIKERAFQGHFSGGYIYRWDLRGTKIASFNGVTVPPLTDGTGRFYVGRVEVFTSGSPNPVTETLVGPAERSNDSRIDYWDHNPDGWSSVFEVKVASPSGPVAFDVLVQELVAFASKYPNAARFDLSELALAEEGKTFAELVDAVNAALTDPMTGALIKSIEFVLPE